jgi:hypothetical protein
MRLLKLLAYGLFGYALYEFIRGMLQMEQQQQQGGGGGMSRSGGGGGGAMQAAARSFGEMAQNITGPGEGQTIETQEFDGGGMRHNVGRGVVRR